MRKNIKTKLVSLMSDYNAFLLTKKGRQRFETHFCNTCPICAPFDVHYNHKPTMIKKSAKMGATDFCGKARAILCRKTVAFGCAS